MKNIGNDGYGEKSYLEIKVPSYLCGQKLLCNYLFEVT